MLLKRLYDANLAQASYLVGCQATGEALVVDPNRDVEQYLRAATDEGLRVTHVTETHIHADFVSGSRELAATAGATLLLSGEGGSDWQYAFAADAGATLLHDGDHFMVGNLRFDVLHTPGHTPEHLTFLVTDTPATDHPMGAFTGDFVFVGDVGRPDLLERAAKVAGTMESSARALYSSLQRFATQPDYLQLFPGHGAGSACGKALGAVPSTTLGYEKLANWAFGTGGEAEFVQAVLAGQPEPPAYFATMKRINREGPEMLNGVRRPARLDAATLRARATGGHRIVDTRPADTFAASHVPGTINIPLNKSFTTWAGALLSYDDAFSIIVDEQCPGCIDEAARAFAMIGLDHLDGYYDGSAVTPPRLDDRTSASIAQITPHALRTRMQSRDVQVVDVRGAAEWSAGHIPGVPNVPLGQLESSLSSLALDEPIVVQCQSGARSSIAASILQARGATDVSNLSGGYAAWAGAGLPTERANG